MKVINVGNCNQRIGLGADKLGTEDVGRRTNRKPYIGSDWTNEIVKGINVGNCRKRMGLGADKPGVAELGISLAEPFGKSEIINRSEMEVTDGSLLKRSAMLTRVVPVGHEG